MTRSRTWTIALLTLGLLTCKNDEEFNYGMMAGTYTGSIAYFTANQNGGVDIYLPELSMPGGYKVTISDAGSDYRLSFDKSFKYNVPDIDVRVNPYYSHNSAKIVSIQAVEGQPYKSAVLWTYPGQPAAYFSHDKIVRSVECAISLKSTDPDSVYYLDFRVFRSY